MTARKPSAAPVPTSAGRAMLDNMIAGRDPWARPRWAGSNLSIVLNTLIRHGWAESKRVDGVVRWYATPAGREAARHGAR